MTDRLLEEINRQFPLRKIDVGKFARIKVSPMKISIKCYDAEGLGRVSVMTGKAFFGLMKMDTLIVNPFERDMALFSYDRIYAMKNDTVFNEIYETRLNPAEEPKAVMDAVAQKYSDIPNEPIPPNWYDDILWKCSMKKTAKSDTTAYFDKLSLEFCTEYLKLAMQAPACDASKKRAEAAKYSEGLISNGGPSTDRFVKICGKEYVEELYRKVLFGA